MLRDKFRGVIDYSESEIAGELDNWRPLLIVLQCVYGWHGVWFPGITYPITDMFCGSKFLLFDLEIVPMQFYVSNFCICFYINKYQYACINILRSQFLRICPIYKIPHKLDNGRKYPLHSVSHTPV
jgi:hypothetical protein